VREYWPELLGVIAAYLCGSIPFGYLLGRIKGIDIRKKGSGNIGATNLTRVLGRPWGVACFILDFLKGLVPVLIIPWLYTHSHPLLPVAVAGAAIAGHIWPVFLWFRGGKGVATSLGALVAVHPQSTPLAVLAAAVTWGIVFLFTRYVSVASLAAAVALPVTAAVIMLANGRFNWVVLGLLAAVAVVLILRHRSNIRRLRQGSELRFEKKTGGTA